jgi:hypothetical protein
MENIKALRPSFAARQHFRRVARSPVTVTAVVLAT